MKLVGYTLGIRGRYGYSENYYLDGGQDLKIFETIAEIIPEFEKTIPEMIKHRAYRVLIEPVFENDFIFHEQKKETP